MTISRQTKNIIFGILVPLACSILFLVLCAINLRGSIWFDESYSAYLIRGNFSEIWSLTASDVHPPLYYFCLKIWSMIFGTSDFAMRFMSVFFGATGIIVLFHLLKRWFSQGTATVATLFVSISPMMIRYGQEMRMYMMVFFIVVLATYLLDLALETKKTRYYVFYAILIALGMWTHYFTAIAWVAHIVYYMVTKRARFWDKKWLLTYALAVLLYLPWIPSFFAQVTEVQKGFWIPSISLNTVTGYMSDVLIFRESSDATDWLAVLVLGLIFALIITGVKVYKALKTKEKQKFWLLFSLASLPPLILIVLSLPPFKPMFVSRYVTYASAFLWALIGIIIVKKFSIIKNTKAYSASKSIMRKIKALAPAIIIATLTVIAAIVGIVNVETRKPEGHISDIVNSVNTIAEEGEPILTSDEWTYYDAIFYTSDKHPIYGVDDWISYQYGSMFPIDHYRVNLIEDLSDFEKNHQSFWYIADRKDDAKSSLDYGLADKFGDAYRVSAEISTPHHVAFELEKK